MHESSADSPWPVELLSGTYVASFAAPYCWCHLWCNIAVYTTPPTPTPTLTPRPHPPRLCADHVEWVHWLGMFSVWRIKLTDWVFAFIPPRSTPISHTLIGSVLYRILVFNFLIAVVIAFMIMMAMMMVIIISSNCIVIFLAVVTVVTVLITSHREFYVCLHSFRYLFS